jgi:hypothetical protein
VSEECRPWTESRRRSVSRRCLVGHRVLWTGVGDVDGGEDVFSDLRFVYTMFVVGLGSTETVVYGHAHVPRETSPPP